MSIELDVGTPQNGFNDWTTVLVRFHGFADLPTTVGERVYSPQFSCLGHQWRLGIYPGGEEDSREGYVGVNLSNFSNTSIEIRYGYSVRDSDDVVRRHVSDTSAFGAFGSEGYADFTKRSKIMESLVDGSFIIEVRMKLPSSTDSIIRFIPTNPLCKNVLQKFMDEESADIVFEVDNESCQNDEHSNKKSKNTTPFYAHRFILQDISTMLAELCKPAEEGITTVSITDIKPGIFNHMIYYTYGGKLSDEDLKDNAKDIINACDKYGVVNLKLEAEATYVESTVITMDNMMDNLLYADSKNLALLKEAVMDYIVANKRDIMGKVSFDNVPSSMITDVLAAMARGEDIEYGEWNSTDYNTMRVCVLRKMLDEKGLDVDGSRESMIALLKEHSA